MPLEGAVIATLAGLRADGPLATACARLAQNSSTAAVTASATIKRRSGVASSSSSCRFMIDPASSNTAGMRVLETMLHLTEHKGRGYWSDDPFVARSAPRRERAKGEIVYGGVLPAVIAAKEDELLPRCWYRYDAPL